MTPDALRRVVLEQLGYGRRSRAELARRTGASDLEVQSILDELLRTARIVRRPQDIGPADYQLIDSEPEEPEPPDMAPAPRRKRRALPQRKRRPPLRGRRTPVLTPEDREQCSLALTELYRQGHLDKSNYGRRMGLLTRAEHWSHLESVFEDLPMPVLARPLRPKPVVVAVKAAVPTQVSFEAKPPAAERELVVKLLKELGVSVVFAGLLIAVRAPLTMAGIVVFMTGWRMFLTYRKWAKKHR